MTVDTSSPHTLYLPYPGCCTVSALIGDVLEKVIVVVFWFYWSPRTLISFTASLASFGSFHSVGMIAFYLLILIRLVTSPPRAWLFADLGIAAQRRTGRSRSSQRESVVRLEFPFRVTSLSCSPIRTRRYTL